MAKMTQKNKAICFAGAFCLACVLFMAVALSLPQETVRNTFTPPPFAENAQQGVPTVPEKLGWLTPQSEGLDFQISVCGEVNVRAGEAEIYFTNYDTNEVWLMIRIMDEDGKILAQSGILKPGEYIRTIRFDEMPKNDQKIYYKVMAYEPENYYSAGSFTLETYAKIGG